MGRAVRVLRVLRVGRVRLRMSREERQVTVMCVASGIPITVAQNPGRAALRLKASVRDIKREKHPLLLPCFPD